MSRINDETTKLTIRLPRAQVEFLKTFAAANGLTATEVISRYLNHLTKTRQISISDLSPELQEFIGSLPADFDIEAARLEHMKEKYGL